MHFIDKKNLTRQIAISSLNETIINNPKKYPIEEKLDLLKILIDYKDNFWISCDCNYPKSLLVICSLRGNIYLRCKMKAAHLPSCQFFINGKIWLSGKNNVIQEIIYSDRLLKYNLYPKSVDFSNILERHEKSTNKTTKSVSKLGQALYTALVDSKLNIIDLAKPLPSLIDQLKAVTESFYDPKKMIHKTIPLSSFYRYSLTPQTLEYAENFLIKANAKFPKNLQPFMLFTGIVTQLTMHSFTVKNGNNIFNTLDRIILPSNWIHLKKSAPYFLITSALIDQNSKVYLKEAFAMPIFSINCLTPVESNFERTILKIILGLTKNKRSLRIEKPLMCFCSEDNKKYRPDFVITNNQDETIYIEVLGSRNEQYLVHKQVMQNLAQNYCNHYISVKAYALDDLEYQNFVNKLQQAISSL